jgi:PiT family inorganic phosphate transporter
VAEFFAIHGESLIWIAAAVGLFMAWGVGANDVANAMGTSVGAKALTIKQAIFVAMIFEFTGAFLAGGEVTETIRKGIVDASVVASDPRMLVYGMIASLLAAAIWLLIASKFGWPVSTTHSIVGAIVGFAAVTVGTDAVHWGKVSSIVASWVVSPLLAGTLAFILVQSVRRLIFNADDPIRAAKRYVPFYMFLTGFVLALVTLLKGLKHVGINIHGLEAVLLAAGIGILVALVGVFVFRRMVFEDTENRTYHFASVERIFAVLMITTACGMAFAHGSNDVANAIGPLAAVYSVVSSGGMVASKAAVPPWILLVGGLGIVVGLATYGHKVIATVGRKITELTPSRGFAAELAAGATVVLASGTGLPVSTTHTLVGAVLGVGLARGIAALDLGVVRNIVASWVITLPAGAGMAILFTYILKAIFS